MKILSWIKIIWGKGCYIMWYVRFRFVDEEKKNVIEEDVLDFVDLDVEKFD